jgi:cell division septum initiation protein DivIVA
LGEKVAPRQVIRRRTDRTKQMFGTAKEKVMGTPTRAGRAVGDQMSAAADTVSSAASATASTVSDAAASAPRATRERVEGNPLAAGLVTFGLAWLISSLLPPSQPEQRLAAQARDLLSEQAQPVFEEAKGAARQVTDELREPAKQAAESVKRRAQEAAGTVKEETISATEEATSGQPPPR